MQRKKDILIGYSKVRVSSITTASSCRSFSGPDDDIVKLYDLTSLCETDQDDNPYTLPVATLLYKMAHNLVLKSDPETRLKESGTIRTLLKNCLDMLEPEKFPEYYCAASYMMSDLLIDDNINDEHWPANNDQTSDLEDDVRRLFFSSNVHFHLVNIGQRQ